MYPLYTNPHLVSAHRKLRKFPYNWAVKARIGNLNRDTNNIVRHPSADKGPRWSINRKHIWHYILPSGCLATRLLQIAETSETILIFFLFERIDQSTFIDITNGGLKIDVIIVAISHVRNNESREWIVLK